MNSMKLDERKEQVLGFIVRDYVESAVPVSSHKISEKEVVDASSATIRNIMLELDEEGFLAQPHASAGRIPTEQGYKYFIKNLAATRVPTKTARREVTRATARLSENKETAFDELSKVLAKQLKLFSGIGILENNRRIFSCGMAEVLKEPEFEERALAVKFANIVDHLEEALDRISQDDDTLKIDIGTFGMVSAPFNKKEIGHGALFSIGPQRMDYEAARSLLQYAADDIIGQTINIEIYG